MTNNQYNHLRVVLLYVTFVNLFVKVIIFITIGEIHEKNIGCGFNWSWVGGVW